MTAPRFDELIHPSTRLSLVALLAAADWSDFSFVRDRLELSDSALSKQLSTLEVAGYVAVDRPLVGRRRRVRARLTPTGRAAFDGHVAALRAVIASADVATANPMTADPLATDSAAVDDGQGETADSASR